MRIYPKNPASQDHIELFAHMGQALFTLQVLEDAISHYIALRKDIDLSKMTPIEEANQYLDKYRSLTFGNALRLMNEEMPIPNQLMEDLNHLKGERDWLVHRCGHENLKGVECSIAHCKSSLFYRIRLISNEANRLNEEINNEFLNYLESQGIDTSKKRMKRGRYL